MRAKNIVLASVVLAGLAVAGGAVKGEAAELLRLYNPNTGHHHYTESGDEKGVLVSKGWHDEGLAWRTPDKGQEVYRMYNPNNGDHHYTVNGHEKNMLVDKGWHYEGVAFQSGGDVPVYRVYNPNAKQGMHHYTLNPLERNLLVSKGWRDEGVAFQAVGKQHPDPAPGGNTGDEDFVIKWTVWFTADHEKNQGLNIPRGSKVFDTEDEATDWIVEYADKVMVEHLASGNFGVYSFQAK
ncbi:calcium-binding protein [Enterococcus sp. CSURQ0835]|uniref:calcium-binding protein n=1 Tax=Enterococcus sp. CSURQ0835 TaxID=2681394 RepID=UPI00190F5E72|nr:calcium-binding protein [Enterococcus sp. CSURQ0835]